MSHHEIQAPTGRHNRTGLRRPFRAWAISRIDRVLAPRLLGLLALGVSLAQLRVTRLPRTVLTFLPSMTMTPFCACTVAPPPTLRTTSWSARPIVAFAEGSLQRLSQVVARLDDHAVRIQLTELQGRIAGLRQELTGHYTFSQP